MPTPDTYTKLTQDTPKGRPAEDKPAALYVAPLGPTAGTGWEPIEVHRNNYPQVLRNAIRPRFEKDVADRISGDPDSLLHVAVDLSGGRTPDWKLLISQQVPALRKLNDTIRRLEEARQSLSRHPDVRSDLRAAIIEAVRTRGAAPALPATDDDDKPKGGPGKRK